MKKRHRDILRDLMQLCNDLGGDLDGTSTCEAKYRDRQQAHRYAYRILLAVLSDHPENDNAEMEWEQAYEAMGQLKSLKEKKYPDRNRNY
jgi:hypothetical protein